MMRFKSLRYNPVLSFSFDQGQMDSRLSFARASTKTYINSAGTLVTGGTNSPAFDFDLVSLLPLGLCYESQTTNLQLRSNGFSYWRKHGSDSYTSTVQNIAGPDGAVSGWTLSNTGQTNPLYGYYYETESGLSPNTVYTLSLYAMALSASKLYLAACPLYSDTIMLGSTVFNLTSRYSGCLINVTTGPSQTSIRFSISTNANIGTIGIYGAQLVTGVFAGSYVEAQTNQTTCASDVLSFIVPPNCGHLTYIFDDNSTQTVAVSPGAYTVPTNLNRPWIKKIVGYA